MSVGEFAPVPAGEDLIAYIRKSGNRRLLILLNLGPMPREFTLLDLKCPGRLILSTHLSRFAENVRDKVALRGDEGVIIELL